MFDFLSYCFYFCIQIAYFIACTKLLFYSTTAKNNKVFCSFFSPLQQKPAIIPPLSHTREQRQRRYTHKTWRGSLGALPNVAHTHYYIYPREKG